MTFISVRCPYCHSDQIVKRGKTRRGTQRYLCHNTACPPQSFLLEYSYQGRLPEVKQQIIDMSLNASGIRDTARVLRISTDTVLRELRKKEAALASVNTALLRTVDPAEIIVDIEQAGEPLHPHSPHPWGTRGATPCTKENRREEPVAHGPHPPAWQ
jgi:insertion element IS1 protein InsB